MFCIITLKNCKKLQSVHRPSWWSEELLQLCRWLHSQVAAGPEVGQLRLVIAMEEGERNNVATFYFTHQEKEEEVAEEEDEGGTASDAENGNQMEKKKKVKRVLHYSTEDIHLLATQVYAGDGTPGTLVQAPRQDGKGISQIPKYKYNGSPVKVWSTCYQQPTSD